MIDIQPAVIDVQAAVISDRASPTSVRDDGSFDNDAVTEKPAARRDIPSSMIEDIDARLDGRSSIPEIGDARPSITARRIENKADGTDIHDARISGQADGIDERAEVIDEQAEVIDERAEVIDEQAEVIDERAEVIDEHDGRIEIRDDRTSFIDRALDEPAERMDQPAERREERGDAIDDGEGRTNRHASPIGNDDAPTPPAPAEAAAELVVHFTDPRTRARLLFVQRNERPSWLTPGTSVMFKYRSITSKGVSDWSATIAATIK